MKKTIKQYMCYCGFIFVLAGTIIFGCRCSTSKSASNPLAGWHFEDQNPNQAIEKDYRDYIQNLSPEERKYVGIIHFLKDETGQHAVSIEVFENKRNASWQHALIYDKQDKRIKVIKYGYRKYES
jgi:uncharacterized protein YfbU (UPF0304 family)